MSEEAAEKEDKRITTPELETVGMVKDFTKNDDLSDLTELEILAIAAYIATNNKICPLPWFMSFREQYVRLRKSKGRMSRQELVEILKKRPTYNYSRSEPEIFPEAEAKPPGWLSKVFKRR